MLELDTLRFLEKRCQNTFLHYIKMDFDKTFRKSLDLDFCICVRCHKLVNEKNFYRMNFKGTGEIRKFKICK